MRPHCFILAICILSVHSVPVQKTETHERDLDSGETSIKEGQQVASPCPDLIDPQTGSTALYFYHGQTNEQRRATQFVNDHWGLPGCCDSEVRSCPSPPDPQPLGSPCPTLNDGNGNPLSLYGNPYTTDQLASNYIIFDSISRHLCSPDGTGQGGASILSFSTTTKSKTETERGGAITRERILDPARGLSPDSSAHPLADLPSFNKKNLAKIGTSGTTVSDANALVPGDLTIDPVHGLTPGDPSPEQKLAKVDLKAAANPEGASPSSRR